MFVSVRHKVGHVLGQGTLKAMVAVTVQTLATSFVQQRNKIHLKKTIRN